MSDLTRTGTTARRRVLGDAHVDRSVVDPQARDAPFVNVITDSVRARGIRETVFLDM